MGAIISVIGDEIKTVSQMICKDPIAGDQHGMCGVCGTEGDGQHKRNDILQKTSANITALFPFNTDSICAWCRSLWEHGKVNPYNRALLATPDRVYFPLIAESEFVSEERPLWSDLMKSLDPDVPRVAILRTETKKRVWPKAKISQGDSLALYFHTDGFSNIINMSLMGMVQALNILEPILSAGFSKRAIRHTLFRAKHKHNMEEVIEWERQLKQLRQSPEFLPALTIAQALKS